MAKNSDLTPLLYLLNARTFRLELLRHIPILYLGLCSEHNSACCFRSINSVIMEWPGSDNPWEGIQVDLIALHKIVCNVMRVPLDVCGPAIPLRENGGEGLYGSRSRLFLFDLQTRKIVARLVTPVKPLFKTESEVASMDYIKSRTKIPIPEIFSYCSEASNPVGAEWILMEYVPGIEMHDVWKDLSPTQRRKLSEDIIEIYAQLSKLKADGCGGIYHGINSVDDLNLARTPRWRPLSLESLKLLRTYCSRPLKDGYLLGPDQSVPLINYRFKVPSPARTPPLYSAEDYVNLIACCGLPTTRQFAHDIFCHDACGELFRSVRNLYPNSRIFGPAAERNGFTFSHGDLHDGNILVDPETGAITGVLDWESAGFRPMFLEVAGVGWLNEDRHRMIHGSWEASNFEGESGKDARLRAFFRTELNKRDNDLFTCFLGGVELRAIFDAAADESGPAGQTIIFLQNYDELGYWNEKRRGPFPWDVVAWTHRFLDLEQEVLAEKRALMEHNECT